jgi:hypothetical protein
MDKNKLAGVVLASALAGLFYWVAKGNKMLKVETKTNTLESMAHFTPGEFRIWWPVMNPELLKKLDRFRELLGFPVAVSAAPGAIGRRTGSTTSRHYYSGEGDTVDAIDVMPDWPEGGTIGEIERAYMIAIAVGFTGIGVGQNWEPRAGLHLDIGERHHVATWGYLDTAEGQRIVSAAEAIAAA